MAEFDAWFSPEILDVERQWDMPLLPRIARLHLLRIFFAVQPKNPPPTWLTRLDTDIDAFVPAPPGLENLWSWIRPLKLDPVENVLRELKDDPNVLNSLQKKRISPIHHESIFDCFRWNSLLKNIRSLDDYAGRKLMERNVSLKFRELADIAFDEFMHCWIYRLETIHKA